MVEDLHLHGGGDTKRLVSSFLGPLTSTFFPSLMRRGEDWDLEKGERVAYICLVKDPRAGVSFDLVRRWMKRSHRVVFEIHATYTILHGCLFAGSCCVIF